MRNYINESFSNIKNHKISTITDLFICDILNLISFGYELSLVTISKNSVQENLMFENLKNEENILSFLRLNTKNCYYYVFVSKNKKNIETNCNFLDFLNLFNKTLYTNITFFHSKTIYFENILYKTSKNWFFLPDVTWRCYSLEQDKKFKNIYYYYNNSALEFTGEIENLNGNCYLLNERTLKNFIIYFTHNVKNKNFYEENKFILNKYNIYYDEKKSFSTDEFIGPVHENRFFTITRKITAEKLTIIWEDKLDFYIVLELLFYSYTQNVDYFCDYKIIINNEIYTNITENMVKNILDYNIKQIDIFFTGNDQYKKYLYDNELWNYHLVCIKK